jgi:hypothetical protein
VVAFAGATVIALLHSLEQPWLKHALQRLVRTSAGVEVDYRVARIELLSGAEIGDLVVRSPTPVRSFAPDLIRIARVEARWSLASILRGRGPIIERLVASDVGLTVVVDERGKTSFDFVGTPTTTPQPTVPLSRQASKFLGTTPPVGEVDIDHITLGLVRTEHAAPTDRTELSGVSIHMAASSAEPTTKGWRLQAGLGSPANPLEPRLARLREGGEIAAAQARCWVAMDATSTALNASLDLRMIGQTFAKSVSADRWLHAEALVRFEPTAETTEINLSHVAAGDGAITAAALIDLSDTGEVLVRHADGDIDLAQLLRWLPVGLVPVTAERARMHYQIDSIAPTPTPHLSKGGNIAIDADISNVATEAPLAPLRVSSGKLFFRAQPAEGDRIDVRGSVSLARTRFASEESDLSADDVAVDLDGRRGPDGVIDGQLGIRFARIERGGSSNLTATDGRLSARVKGLYPEPDEVLKSRGDLTLSIDLGSVDAQSPGGHAIVDGLSVRAHTAIEGHAPYAVELESVMSRMRVSARDGRILADSPARVECRAHDLKPDFARAKASRGGLSAALEMGVVRASLDAEKGDDALDYALSVTASNLSVVRPFLPPALAEEAPWDRIGVSVRSSGRVEGLRKDSPALVQTTEVDLDRPAFQRMTAQALSLVLQSQGSVMKHEANVDLHVQGLAFGSGNPNDDHATVWAAMDRGVPSLRFQIATDGRAATKISGSLSFDRSRHSLPYEIEGHVAGLAPLAPLVAKVRGLDAFDLSQLELNLSSRGSVLGAIAAIAQDGAITWEPNPLATAAVEGKTDLRVAHFRWARGDTAIMTPALAWHGDTNVIGSRRTLDSHVEVGTLHLDLGSRDVDLSGIGDDARAAVTGSLADPEIELTQHLAIRAVEQNVIPEYPLGNLTFALSAARSRDGVVHISEMKVANGVGGTSLSASGNVELSDARHTLSLTTLATQDLQRLSSVPERFKGRGTMAVEASIASPDLARYHVRATVRGEDVTANLSRAGIDVEGANGEVPITVAIKVGANGVALERSDHRNPYSMLRFADQHPLLSHSGFISINRLRSSLVSIAPLVGNLAIEQNVISLRQFEMGVRGGRITGQCAVDWEGPKSTIELHVRASGVQSSHGEPFDGNIAVAISAADRTVNGRAEILRIGERHLLDLLDLQDPLHVDAAMNRIRTALAFGYPESLRLVFDHGFASAHLELGGLARLISISEIRGIPMGPIVDKMLAPALSEPNTKEMP